MPTTSVSRMNRTPGKLFAIFLVAAACLALARVKVVPIEPIALASLDGDGAGPDIAGLKGLPSAGAADPRVIVLFAYDFRCPASRMGVDVLRELLAEHGDLFRVYFVGYPLWSNVPALAAEAAHLQGRFFAFAEKAFADPRRLSEDLAGMAREAGLDPVPFDRDRTSQAAVDRLGRELAISNAAVIRSTPVFVVNGRVLRGARPFEELEAAIVWEAERVSALQRTGEPASEALRRVIAGDNPRGEDFVKDVMM